MTAITGNCTSDEYTAFSETLDGERVMVARIL